VSKLCLHPGMLGRARTTYLDGGTGKLWRRCNRCKVIKLMKEFGEDKNDHYYGQGYTCRPCARERSRERYLQSRHGLDSYSFAVLWAAQGGVCAICGEVPKGRPQVDHDHKTGQGRDMLCGPCNRMLGNARDRPEILENGAAYLRAHAAPPAEEAKP
jgi:hypothetical protein